MSENMVLQSTVKEYEDKLTNKSRQVSNLENRIRTLEKKLTRAEMDTREARSELQEREALVETSNKQVGNVGIIASIITRLYTK